jgi:hypothetical protein
MLNTSASHSLGIAFVLVGAINVSLILQASAGVKDAKASARMIAPIGSVAISSSRCSA